MFSWNHLPREVRVMIPKYVARDYEARSRADYRRLANYAAVSTEFQLFFEAKTFRRLQLEPSDLLEFSHLVGREKGWRLNHVKHLWLRVKLDEYDCSVCRVAEDATAISRNNSVFTGVVLDLLNTLSAANGKVWASGLTLELSVHSPSDSQHVYRSCQKEDNYPFNAEEDLTYEIGYHDYHLSRIKKTQETDDQHHGMSTPGLITSQRRRPTLADMQRMRGTVPISLQGELACTNLPLADIIEGLVIRRRNHRNIAISALAQLMRQSFHRLRSFRNEQYLDVDSTQQMLSADEYRNDLLPHLPLTLRHFHIFQGDDHRLVHHEPFPDPAEMVRMLFHEQRRAARMGLRSAVLEASYQCEEFSLTSLIDASVFFLDYFPGHFETPVGPYWPNLRRLLLKSNLFYHGGDWSPTGGLIQAAAMATKQMPKLETLELWRSSLSSAALFRYSLEDDIPIITWRSTWKHSYGNDLPPEMLYPELWGKTTEGHGVGSADVQVRIEPLHLDDADLWATDGDCIYRHLKLNRLLLDPVSLHEVEWEAKFGRTY